MHLAWVGGAYVLVILCVNLNVTVCYVERAVRAYNFLITAITYPPGPALNRIA